VAVLAGKLYRGVYAGKYLIFLDADKQEAIKAICGLFNSDLGTIAKYNLVEQHLDNSEKAHVYIIAEAPIPAKGSNKTGLEIKSEGKHGLAYCTPSIHKNGSPYEIIGTQEPFVMSAADIMTLRGRLDNFYRKHGFEYIREYESPQNILVEPNYDNHLTAPKMQALLNKLLPFYVKPNRDRIAMDLAGYLRKEGVPELETFALIDHLCVASHDEERSSRLEMVRRTYKRDINSIRGYSGLKELLDQ
jgi:hypothetical protein